MKNLLLTGFALAACASMAASDVWKVGDIEYNVDTLFHANVGPGTTQTSLHFSSESRNLRAFYLTVDLKNPVLDIRAVVAQDKLAAVQQLQAWLPATARRAFPILPVSILTFLQQAVHPLPAAPLSELRQMRRLSTVKFTEHRKDGNSLPWMPTEYLW